MTLNITQIVVSGLDHFDAHPDLMYAPAYTSLKRPGSSHSDARTNARTTSIRGVHNHICTFNMSTRARAHGRGAHIYSFHASLLRGSRHSHHISAPRLAHSCAATASFVDRYLAGSHSIGSKVTLRNALATIYVRLEVESAGPSFQDDV